MSKDRNEKHNAVEFNKGLSRLGIMAGVFLFVCLPLLVMIIGREMGSEAQSAIIITSIIIGGVIVAVAVFVGTVIPTRINDNKPDEKPPPHDAQ
ncbi:MAG: hypothetical protein IT445_07125 [Phycisphaeraceae bacterium]|nr:hypothetical protein [Phycisphaeraceae bacterium]